MISKAKTVGMRRSQQKSASVGCRFHVQNPLVWICRVIKIITSFYSYSGSTYVLKIKQLQTNKP